MQRILYMNVNILKDTDLYDKGMSMISEWRKKKLAKMKNPAAARLSLGAGILLQLAMEEGGYADLKDSLVAGTHGKPYLPGVDFHFSLSHSGEYAICVYGDVTVGVDIQKVKDSIPKYLDKILSEEEKVFLSTFNKEAKEENFYRIWSRKESLIKWDGR